MGSDLTVVNSARVSFAKESDWDYKVNCIADCSEHGHYPSEFCVNCDKAPVLKQRDKKLIRYLAVHNHWTPFAQCEIQLRLKSSIFVARQLAKHQVGFVWNEESRRYIDNDPEYYIPKEWRLEAENKKQGSSEEVVDLKDLVLTEEDEQRFQGNLEDFLEISMQSADDLYKAMRKRKIAPEMARMVLPVNMYVSWYWKGSLAAFARVCQQRLDPHAQEETSMIVQKISDIIEPLFPVSWYYLTNAQKIRDNNTIEKFLIENKGKTYEEMLKEIKCRLI